MGADSFVDLKPNPNIPDFRPGDTVRVHAKVIEGNRERVQVFEGVVIRVRRGGPGAAFTVRRVSHGVGVERIFPFHSPLVEKVEVSRVGRVRRARLYYLRKRVGKAARIKAGSRARFEELTAVPELEPEEYAEDEPIAEEPEASADVEPEASVEEEAESGESGPQEGAADDAGPVEGGEPAAEAGGPEDEAPSGG